VIYIDSSVALAHLFREPRRPADPFWSQPLVSSKLLEYEVWNRVHAYQLSGSHGNEARLLLTRVILIELDEAVLSRALDPFPIRVRTLDALHLATIEFASAKRESIELASYDHRMLAAARALGISVAEL
jgi:predicted nucleic acid-binding protein